MSDENYQDESSTTEETSEALEAATPSVTTITVDNPTLEEAAELADNIAANFSSSVNVTPTGFKFKKSKDSDTGAIIDRHPVVIAVPSPNVQGLIDIIEAGGKGLDLLLEVVQSTVNSAVREELYTDVTFTAQTFPVDKVSWEAIANKPKAQRTGAGIPKDVWDAFTTDYCTVMLEATGKTIEQVTRAAKLLAGKFTACKTNKDVIEVLIGQLGIYAEATPNVEQFTPCISFLSDKAETLLNQDDAASLADFL